MKKFLAPFLLLTLLFPVFAIGEPLDDLVKREGIHYKKFSDVPLTGKTTGYMQGSFKNGKKDGPWVRYWLNGQLAFKTNWKDGKKVASVSYHDNGQLWEKPSYQDGKLDGLWVSYHDNGQLLFKGIYKDGVKVE